MRQNPDIPNPPHLPAADPIPLAKDDDKMPDVLEMAMARRYNVRIGSIITVNQVRYLVRETLHDKKGFAIALEKEAVFVARTTISIDDLR